MPTSDAGRIGRHVPQLDQGDAFGFLRLGLLDNVLPRSIIVAAVQQDAFGIEAITTGTAGFLLIVLKRLGHSGVNDSAHVGFVDTHPKRYRGYDDIDVFLDEGILSLLAPIVGQAGVISSRAVSSLLQSFGQIVDIGATDTIDNRRFFLVAIEYIRYLLQHIGAALNRVDQVGTIERADEDLWFGQMKLLRDVVAHMLGGSGGVGVDGSFWKRILETAQPTVLGAEIVTPHADTMGFINCDHGNGVLIQEIGESGHHQPLG